jgi:hypothetical protein
LEQSNSTVPRRGQKTGQIADDSPTDGNDHRLTVGAEQSHLLPKASELLNGLARLTAGDFDHRGIGYVDGEGFANFLSDRYDVSVGDQDETRGSGAILVNGQAQLGRFGDSDMDRISP